VFNQVSDSLHPTTCKDNFESKTNYIQILASFSRSSPSLTVEAAAREADHLSDEGHQKFSLAP